MTVYTTLAAMIRLFGERELVELTDDIESGAVNETRVTDAIAYASSLIDGYLAARHRLPLSEVPAWLPDTCADLARHRLWRTTPPEAVAKAHDAAMSKLKDVASGKLRLDQGEEREAPRPGAIITGGPDRVFSRETLNGF